MKKERRTIIHKLITNRPTKVGILVLLVFILPSTAYGQKNFSFFDGLTVSGSSGIGFGSSYTSQTGYIGEKVLIVSFDNLLEIVDEEQDQLKRSNPIVYDVDLKYYIKAYKYLRVGFGLNYSFNKMEMDYHSTPRLIEFPVHLFHLEKDLHFYGYSYGLTFAWPKRRWRFSISEARLFRKIPKGEDSDFKVDYTFSRIRGVDYFEEGYRARVQFANGRGGRSTALKGGVSIEYRIFKEMYVGLKLENFSMWAGSVKVQHVYAENVNGVSKSTHIGNDMIGVPYRRISLGLSYRFFSKEYKSAKRLVE